MKIPAIPMSHMLYARVARSDEHELIERHDDYSTLRIKIDAMRLSHDGDERAFRPFVRIKGQLEGITPSRRLPAATSDLTFPDESGPSVDIRYDFTNDQIVRMIENGYFEEGYGFIDDVRGDTLEIEAPVDYKISREFDDKGLDTPIVFYDVPDRANIVCDEYSTGYDFTDYMKVPEKTIEEVIEREAEDEFTIENDIFADQHRIFEETYGVSFDEAESEAKIQPEVDVTPFEAERNRVVQEYVENTPEPQPELTEAERIFREKIESRLSERTQRQIEPESEHEVEDDHDYDSVYDYGESSNVSQHQIDFGELNLSSVSQSSQPQQEIDPNEIDTEEGLNDYLFGDEEDVADEKVDENESFVQDGIVDDPSREETEEEESKARIARMLAQHTEEQARLKIAHDYGVDEKDITPGS